MKKILIILFLLPYLVFAQDTTVVEVCTHNQSHLQVYSVNNGPNQYYWNVEGGVIVGNGFGNSIKVNWLNVPYNLYLITVYVISNEGCYGDTATLWVDIDECSYDGIYIPNSFTPTNDGINDIFKPVGQNLKEIDMYIFNRWGELIYEMHRLDEGWDGTYKGTPCQQEVYVWLLKYKFEGNNFNEELRGHVTLVR
jgi:gliding motility-associated-like protein